MMTESDRFQLNQPVWIDTMAGFFHQYTQGGMCRVGFPKYRWAEVPVTWVKEREVRA